MWINLKSFSTYWVQTLALVHDFNAIADTVLRLSLLNVQMYLCIHWVILSLPIITEHSFVNDLMKRHTYGNKSVVVCLFLKDVWNPLKKYLLFQFKDISGFYKDAGYDKSLPNLNSLWEDTAAFMYFTLWIPATYLSLRLCTYWELRM